MRISFALLFSLGAVLMVTPARAQTFYNLDVPLYANSTQAGTLSGWFELNATLSAVLSYDLVASPAPGFAGFEYTPSDSTTGSLPGDYQIRTSDFQNVVLLNFSPAGTGNTPSTTGPAPFYSPSSEMEGAVKRNIVGDAIPTAVPEPSSWALASVALSVAALLARRIRLFT